MNKEQRLREEAPYGMQVDHENGSAILFNRVYRTIWIKDKDGLHKSETDLMGGDVPNPRARGVTTIWFFRDGNPPWRNKATRILCGRVLYDFGVREGELWKLGQL